MRLSIFDSVGSKAENVTDVKSALVQMGIDFEPVKAELFYEFNGNKIKNKGKVAIIRSDSGEEIGNMGEGYHPYSNEKAFDVLNVISKQIGAIFERGGQVKNKFFLSLKMPFEIVPSKRPKDITRIYFTAFNAFDGSIPVVFAENSVRIVCSNSFQTSLNTGFARVRHSALTDGKVEQIKYQLAFAMAEKDELQKKIDILDDRPATIKDAEDFAYTLFQFKRGDTTGRDERKIENITRLFKSEATGNIGKSRLDIFNATTEALDHYATNKETEGGTVNENRFESSFMGPNSKMKVRAMELLLN